MIIIKLYYGLLKKKKKKKKKKESGNYILYKYLNYHIKKDG